MMFSNLRIVAVVLTVVLARGVIAADESLVPWFAEKKLRLASVEQGVDHLTRRDRFVEALSRFDRQSRLQAAEDPGTERFLEFVGQQVQPWRPADADKVRTAVAALRRRLEPWALPLPDEILLIHTTGQEEGEAAYCRGPAIILPRKVLQRGPEDLERLLAHELFHVLSNQNPEWRRRVYRLVGFEVSAPIELPSNYRDRKLTNPDGPVLDNVVRIPTADGPRSVTPVLYASVDRYDPKQGGSFFRYLTFRLLVLEPASNDTWRAALRDGQPQLLEPQSTEGYFERIGRNTNYIIHPDEVLADNFVHTIFGTANLKTPQLIEEFRRELQKK